MGAVEAQRTLVKSLPEVWAQLSETELLGAPARRHLRRDPITRLDAGDADRVGGRARRAASSSSRRAASARVCGSTAPSRTPRRRRARARRRGGVARAAAAPPGARRPRAASRVARARAAARAARSPAGALCGAARRGRRRAPPPVLAARLSTRISARCPSARPTATQEKLAQLAELRHEAAHAEGPAVAKQHAKGKYTARERIEKLLDPGSFQRARRVRAPPHDRISGWRRTARSPTR